MESLHRRWKPSNRFLCCAPASASPRLPSWTRLTSGICSTQARWAALINAWAAEVWCVDGSPFSPNLLLWRLIYFPWFYSSTAMQQLFMHLLRTLDVTDSSHPFLCLISTIGCKYAHAGPVFVIVPSMSMKQLQTILNGGLYIGWTQTMEVRVQFFILMMFSFKRNKSHILYDREHKSRRALNK